MDGALRFLSAPMKDFVILGVPFVARTLRAWADFDDSAPARFDRMGALPCSDQVDKEMGDQYSLLFAATAFFGSGACGALSQLNPDAE
jgi:hypothetical protein